MNTQFETIIQLLRKGKAADIKIETQNALDSGFTPKEILEEALMEGMSIVGELFKNNQIFVPEMLIAARAMNASLSVLKPHLVTGDVVQKGTVILGTVKGDLHDIGKNLVKIMMEGKGLEVIDLGVDVPAESFVQKAAEHNAQIIALSALLTTTMAEMGNVVKAFEQAGTRNKVKILIGGAPVSETFRIQIGADFYTSDATSAADAAILLCKS